jgi:hypothetical protein
MWPDRRQDGRKGAAAKESVEGRDFRECLTENLHVFTIDQMSEPSVNLSRRGFFGLLAGAVAMPIVAPLIKPKKSFFFFAAQPEVSSFKEVTFDLQEAIDRLPACGGVVKIPTGAWILNQAIFISNNVVLRGEGLLHIASCHFMSSPDRKHAFLEVSGDTRINGCVFEGGGGPAFAMTPG